MATLTIIEKMRRERKEIQGEELDYTPLVIQAGYVKPDTLNEAVNRVLANSMSHEAYERLRGIEYDYESDDDADNFDEVDFDDERVDDDRGYFVKKEENDKFTRHEFVETKKGELKDELKRKNNAISNDDSLNANIHQSVDNSIAAVNDKED